MILSPLAGLWRRIAVQSKGVVSKGRLLKGHGRWILNQSRLEMIRRDNQSMKTAIFIIDNLLPSLSTGFADELLLPVFQTGHGGYGGNR
jgi:hypothetical protein